MIKEQIQLDLVASMRAKDANRLSALRMVKSALDRAEKDQGKPLDESSEQKILSTLVKQRKDSITMFLEGNRKELATKEQAELALIESYMPKEATDTEIETAIDETILEIKWSGPVSSGHTDPQPIPASKMMGLIMKALPKKLNGKRVDGRKLSELVKLKLDA